MKQFFLLSLALLFSFQSYSQYRTTRQNGVLGRTEEFESNSPGNMIANSILLAYYKDHTAMGFTYPSIEFWNFTSTRNDGIPTSVAWFDNSGFLKRSPMPSFLLAEVDPQWTSEKSNYYDKITSDGRYLQGFTELDPIWTAASGNYRTKVQNDLLYKDISYIPTFSSITGKPTTLSGYGITDAYPLSGNPSNFLTSIPAQTWTSITGKPAFATVATSGSYNDLINKPKIAVPYSGISNASGNYTVTFPLAYSVAPNIQVCLINANVRDTPIVTVSTTGFTVNIQRRTDVLGLLPTYANVNGGLIDVLITEK